MKRALLGFGLVLLLCVRAYAHRPSDSYLVLSPGSAPGALAGSWDIALRDLDHALGLDDGDGSLTWGELHAREAECTGYALARLGLRTAQGACSPRAALLQIVQLSDGAYARLPLEISCPGRTSALFLQYRFLADLDRDHRLLVRMGAGAESATQVVTASPKAVRLRAMPASEPPATAASVGLHFVGRGLTHIFAGLDHILFLLVLLLPAVVRRKGRSFHAVTQIRPVLCDVLKIVTAFTLAHSLTLSLAALGIVSVSANVIEPAIAASVTLAALNNLQPLFDTDRWAMALALGLLHGFGFSSALSDAGLSGVGLLPALFGFNLGVELGQLAIVGGFVPLAFFARRTRVYRTYVVFGGSAAVFAVSLFWLFQRIQTG
jgi:hypothetical protein